MCIQIGNSFAVFQAQSYFKKLRRDVEKGRDGPSDVD